MSTNKIKTPRGTLIRVNNTTVKLTWNDNFSRNWGGAYSKAQVFLDSEILRQCDPYIPMQSSMLKKSGILGTVIGSGVVQWIVPYAHHQYYYTALTRAYDLKRGAKWFERMKADHGKEIIASAKKIAGRG